MTAVFFLFLLHLSLGLLAMLPFIVERAGASFFKFCSAAAAFMITAGLGLVYRRYGLTGPAGSALPDLALLAGATLALLVLTVLYNRAWHFGWQHCCFLFPLPGHRWPRKSGCNSSSTPAIRETWPNAVCRRRWG